MPTDLPDVAHTWDRLSVPGARLYACRHCGAVRNLPPMSAGTCPDLLAAALAAAEARGREQVRAQVREALAELAHAMAEAQAHASGYDEGWAGRALGLAEAIDTIEAALGGEETP